MAAGLIRASKRARDYDNMEATVFLEQHPITSDISVHQTPALLPAHTQGEGVSCGVNLRRWGSTWKPSEKLPNVSHYY